MMQNRKNNRKKIVAIIPAYNEAATIAQVVLGVLQNTDIVQCLVIDDGSTDNTAAYARSAGARVIRQKKNSGVGLAIKHGLAVALQRKIDYIITLDADGQHDPKYIPCLIAGMHDNNEYVIASRYTAQTPNSTQYLRRLGTKIISLAIKKKYSITVSDPTSGFRILSQSVARKLSRQYPVTFSEPEIILQLIGWHISITEISVPMFHRKHGHSSITFLRGAYMLAYILIHILKAPKR